MKAAAVVFKKDDYIELESYDRLLYKAESLLRLCQERNINVVVFPALIGCLFNDGERYINDIIEFSNIYKGMAICPGSYYEREAGRTYHSSCIIMDGNIIMQQRQLYLAKWEKDLGLSRGIRLNSISILGMKLGIMISTDAFYPQVSRAFAMSGVELVLTPIAIKGSQNMSRQLAGLWQNVQANLFFGIESSFNGTFNGYDFQSTSIIHAPLEMTFNEDGFLAREEKDREDSIITAELDNKKRKEAVNMFNTLAKLNTEAYKDIFLTSCSGGCHEGAKGIRAAAVQRRITTIKSIKAYTNLMEGFVKSAAEQGCDIIAFPEYNFFELLGLIPGFGLLNSYLNRKTASAAGSSLSSAIKRLYPLLCSISVPIQNAIERVMSGLASKYSIYIYTGSYFIKRNGLLYNGGAIISREGRILGRQMKLQLTDFEEKLGIQRDNEFKVFSLDIGSVAFPVCMDATYYEVFNLARSHGCDIVVLPIANNEEYGLHRALRGIWPRVQESHVYGVKAALNGWFCGLHFTGKAGVFAPIGMTANGDGVVSVSKDFEGDSIIVGDIDLEALYKERKEAEYYGDCNPEFERDFCLNTYGSSIKVKK